MPRSMLQEVRGGSRCLWGLGPPSGGRRVSLLMCKTFKSIANIKKSASSKNSDFWLLLKNLDYLANPVADMLTLQQSAGGGRHARLFATVLTFFYCLYPSTSLIYQPCFCQHASSGCPSVSCCRVKPLRWWSASSWRAGVWKSPSACPLISVTTSVLLLSHLAKATGGGLKVPETRPLGWDSSKGEPMKLYSN